MISGTVTAATGGADQSGICVYATDTSGYRLGSATTADDGTYTITGWRRAATTSSSPTPGSTALPPQWYDDQATELTSTPVSVTAGSTVA